MEENIENKYVAYCDILGFSNSVINDFDKVITIYKDFRTEIDKYDFLELKISIYSDSILSFFIDLFLFLFLYFFVNMCLFLGEEEVEEVL